MQTSRVAKDVLHLKLAGYVISDISEDLRHFRVQFPREKQMLKDTPYAGGVWELVVDLPVDYPLKSPSVAFATPFFHANVEQTSGAICLDTLNQKWTPISTLFSVFELFLPWLCYYPNPDDPLNPVAARLSSDPKAFAARVQEDIFRQEHSQRKACALPRGTASAKSLPGALPPPAEELSDLEDSDF